MRLSCRRCQFLIEGKSIMAHCQQGWREPHGQLCDGQLCISAWAEVAAGCAATARSVHTIPFLRRSQSPLLRNLGDTCHVAYPCHAPPQFLACRGVCCQEGLHMIRTDASIRCKSKRQAFLAQWKSFPRPLQPATSAKR